MALAAPLAFALKGPATPGAMAQPPLRTLTTLQETHALSPDQARRNYPIHLRAIVTFYYRFPDSRHSDLFLQDATGSSYATIPAGSEPPANALPPGTLVDVTAVSAAGDFAPILDRTHITVVGPSHLPTYAKPVSFSDLLTGSYDSTWVQIEGVVHSVVESSGTDHPAHRHGRWNHYRHYSSSAPASTTSTWSTHGPGSAATQAPPSTPPAS
jgi:hypothetical protein